MFISNQFNLASNIWRFHIKNYENNAENPTIEYSICSYRNGLYLGE